MVKSGFEPVTSFLPCLLYFLFFVVSVFINQSIRCLEFIICPLFVKGFFFSPECPEPTQTHERNQHTKDTNQDRERQLCLLALLACLLVFPVYKQIRGWRFKAHSFSVIIFFCMYVYVRVWEESTQLNQLGHFHKKRNKTKLVKGHGWRFANDGCQLPEGIHHKSIMDTPGDKTEAAGIFYRFLLRVYNTAKASAHFDHTDYLTWLLPYRAAVTIADYAASITGDAFDRAFIQHASSLEKPEWRSTFANLVTTYQFQNLFWWDLKLWHDDVLQAGVRHWKNTSDFIIATFIWTTNLPEKRCARRKCYCCCTCTCDDPLLAVNSFQSTTATVVPAAASPATKLCGLRHRRHVQC